MHSDHDPIQIYIHSSVYPVCIHDRQYQEIGSQPCGIKRHPQNCGLIHTNREHTYKNYTRCPSAPLLQAKLHLQWHLQYKALKKYLHLLL